MPFGAELIMSNRKMFRYEWIWQRNTRTGFLNAKKMPLRTHDNILVFYDKLPTYNPQKWQSKPYFKWHLKRNGSKIYEEKQDVFTDNQDGNRYPLDILNFNRDIKLFGRGELYHPTQKPVDLLEYLIKTYTNEGELVLDNCIGSGSTAVAAINTNRNFIGFETDSHYCEVANKRIEEAIAAREMRLAL